MNLKLFGNTGPTPAFKRDLQLLSKLSEPDRVALREWFHENAALGVPDQRALADLLKKTTLDAAQLATVVTLLKFLLTSWGSFGLNLSDIENDLGSIGYSETEREPILRILSELQPFRDAARFGSIKHSYEVAGVPTIDDVNIVWDIRPIFEDFAFSAASENNRHTSLLGITYLLMLEIEASRADGKNETSSFQLREEDVDSLLDGLSRAKEQLAVLKDRKGLLR